MPQAQTYEPLTDDELLSVHGDPSLMVKLTEPERKRLGNLLLVQKGQKPLGGERADSSMLGVDHDALLQGLASMASKLPRPLQEPAAMGGTFTLDALASLAEMLSAPENVAGMGAGTASQVIDAGLPIVGKGLSAAGRGVETVGRRLSTPARFLGAYDVIKNPVRGTATMFAPDVAQAAGRGMQRMGAALQPLEDVVVNPESFIRPPGMNPVRDVKAESPLELTRRMKAERATSPVESAVGETAPPVGPPVSEPPASAQTAPKTPKQLNEEALARRRAEYQARLQADLAKGPKMSAEEFRLAEEAYTQLRMKGKSHEEALRAVEAMRAMNAVMGLKTPTAAETTFPKGMRGAIPKKPS